MNSDLSPEFAFPDPLAADWTIAGLLEWIGADDARCHDRRLTETLDAVGAALGTSARPGTAPVASVRALAMRVAAEPSVGELRLADLIVVTPVPVGEPTDRGVLLAV